eukprot:SAG31_NODE_3726_length_3943_cov_3.054588_3_plen_46_part_00
MNQSLSRLKAGEPVDDLLTPWPELRAEVGFDQYYELEARYAARSE